MRIALDFDGTLGDSVKSWLLKYNEIFGKKRNYKEIDQWHFHESFGLNVEESMDLFGMIWDNAVVDILPTEPQIGMKVEEFSKYEMIEAVDIVTAIPKKHWGGIKEWLQYYNVPYGKMVYSMYKEETDYDIFIDDKPILLHNASPRPVFLKHQRWNKLENAKFRFQSFEEIPDLIKDVVCTQPYSQYTSEYLGVWGNVSP